MILFADFFDNLEIQFKNERPFVAYRKPNAQVLKGLLQTNSELYHTTDFTESGFVFAPFNATERAILIPSSQSKVIESECVSSIELPTLPHDTHDEKSKEFHLTLVEKGIESIKSNEFQKVVLSRREIIDLKNSNPLEIFTRLLNRYESAFVYCFYHPNVGLWLGATPETLLSIKADQLTTMALAGTQKFEGTTDVVWHKKEQEEQQFVTDFIKENLQSDVRSLKASEAETIKTGNLLHLKTTITAQLDSKTSNLKKILHNLHPTPAVCGMPKESAKHFILKNEDYAREFYTGFLGELNIKETTSRNSNRRNVENNAYASVQAVSNLYVNLRCMQLKENQAIIYVGGGITKDSIPENEWEETVSKSEVIKSIL